MPVGTGPAAAAEDLEYLRKKDDPSQGAGIEGRLQASGALDIVDQAFQHCRRTVKRRQAMLASNLPRNSPSELIRPRHGQQHAHVAARAL